MASIITEHEQEQLEKANESGLTPVVFIHGLWLLPNSWDRWRSVGLRRALGATKGNVRGQFLVESVLLSCCGGLAGVAIGAAITGGYARSRGWTLSIPVSTLGAGVGASLVLGALVGLYPAGRAARLAPAAAIKPT